MCFALYPLARVFVWFVYCVVCGFGWLAWVSVGFGFSVLVRLVVVACETVAFAIFPWFGVGCVG